MQLPTKIILKLLANFLILSYCCDAIKLSNKEAYSDLKKTIVSIKQSCGEVCDQSIKGKPGKYFDEITKNIQCLSLFSNPDIDKPSKFEEAPMKIPKWLQNDYSYQGRVKLKEDYRDESNIGKHQHTNFTLELIGMINDRLDKNIFEGPYGKQETDNLNRIMKDHLDVKEKHILIIGSESPWIETMALRLGARHITTVDYVEIISEDPRITTLHASKFHTMFLHNKLPEFDALISYSSLEHSGLGRYGDSLNPWGDLIAMARAWCVLKPGKKALIGIPIGPHEDFIYFNSHKLYGPVMLSHFFANWKQIYSELDYEKFQYINDKYFNFDHYRNMAVPCVWKYQEIFVVEK